MKNSFVCENCRRKVSFKAPGTAHRNHCHFCLWSKHVDFKISGDRKSSCGGLMAPIGLTFKKEGIDKFSGKPRQGEIMLVHRCQICGKISLNRIAGDDEVEAIWAVFEKSLNLEEETKKELGTKGIKILDKNDEKEIKTQLYGKNYSSSKTWASKT